MLTYQQEQSLELLIYTEQVKTCDPLKLQNIITLSQETGPLTPNLGVSGPLFIKNTAEIPQLFV